MAVQLEQYQKAYSFTVLKPAPSVEDLAAWADKVHAEPFKARRGLLAKRLRWECIKWVLQADVIQLPFRTNPNGVSVQLDTPDLYVGGITERVSWIRWVKENPPRQWVEGNSLYIGDMPKWVVTKVQQAQRFRDALDLVVVSRDPSLFHVTERRLVTGSPLLVGYSREHNEKLLLAAWGLEHELPKSLGGLLPDPSGTPVVQGGG